MNTNFGGIPKLLHLHTLAIETFVFILYTIDLSKTYKILRVAINVRQPIHPPLVLKTLHKLQVGQWPRSSIPFHGHSLA